MRVRRINIILPSRQVERTCEFYVKKLSFKEEWWSPELCTVSLSYCSLTFFPTKSARLVAAHRTPGNLVGFEIDGIQGYYQQLEEKGVDIVNALELMQPGVQQFSIRDNNGYQIGFSQDVPDKKSLKRSINKPSRH